ncbi:shTK domain protein [Necator americanus]|uniref:ShTK domain protein n=1 Tax=Necator americanus TaxID=51031 RepID=W2TD03_NECAM|nr:shTK domain protein [Necator americanus]ETN79713.1 shTK domain protein [Necator americanus]
MFSKILKGCVNLHECCGSWALKGDCASNPEVMDTICPASCAQCQPAYNVVDSQMKPLQYAKLANDAAPSGQRPSPSPPPSTTSKTCLNSHTCCSYWASQGKCDSVSDIMEKVCKASCTCQPSYNTGACDDFIKGCMNMQRLGLCTVDYFAENCRKTCNKCPSSADDADCEASMDNMSTYDNNTGSAPSHPSPPVYEKVPEVEESGYN